MKPQDDRDWTELEGIELAKAVCDLVDNLSEQQKGREAEHLQCVNRYECRELESLDPQAYVSEPGTEINLLYPLERSLVNTVHADMTRTKHKPRFLTTGADWDVQRRAIRLQQFVVGQLHYPQGGYHDGWQAMDAAWRDAEVTGEGYVYVYPDYERECIAIERLLPWQVGVDATDAEYGCPSTYWRTYLADKKRLKALFCDGDPEATTEEKADRAACIEAAANAYRSTAEAYRSSARCEVREIWSMGSEENPGRHCICIDNCVLFEEDYVYPDPPFVVMRWEQHITGWGGTGLVYEAQLSADALNQVLRRIMSGYRIRSGRRTYYVRDSIDPTDLQANDDETFIPVDAGAQLPVPEVIPALQPGEIEFASALRQWGHEGTGVSMMAAMSRKEEGLNSGRAIRTAKDLGTARFLPQQQARENAFKRLFQLIIRCAKELAEECPTLIARWPGQAFLKEVEWKHAKLDDAVYIVELDTENASATDVAGRVATLEEGLSAGLVSPETFNRLTSGTLDIQRESHAVNAERQYHEELIDSILDAQEDDDFELEGPEPFIIDKLGIMTLFIQAYWDAKRKRAPQFNQELLRRWIDGVDRMIQQAAVGGAPGGQPAASPQPPPGGAPIQ